MILWIPLIMTLPQYEIYSLVNILLSNEPILSVYLPLLLERHIQSCLNPLMPVPFTLHPYVLQVTLGPQVWMHMNGDNCVQHSEVYQLDYALPLPEWLKGCVHQCDPSSVSPFLTCRLIALDKHPGVCPIDIGDTARRIVAKAVLHTLRPDIQAAIGCIQLCGRQISGIEVTVHAVRCVSIQMRPRLHCLLMQVMQFSQQTDCSPQHYEDLSTSLQYSD